MSEDFIASYNKGTLVIKRLFDIFVSIAGLLSLLPFFLVFSLWIKVDSKGPVFFRQTRVGKNGKLFRIFKFRTMVVDAERKGLQITTNSDSRVTKAGTFLRKTKIDELPQLINVFIGDMSFVGPRPEVPKYIDCYPESIKKIVLSVRPGITDRASIEFKDENDMLDSSSEPERTYINDILPIKQKYYVEYVSHISFWGDIKIILDTIGEIM
ncbi:MAG: sugar transferase [Synergistaceae bacterium]